jgi:hypothetical protein
MFVTTFLTHSSQQKPNAQERNRSPKKSAEHRPIAAAEDLRELSRLSDSQDDASSAAAAE